MAKMNSEAEPLPDPFEEENTPGDPPLTEVAEPADPEQEATPEPEKKPKATAENKVEFTPEQQVVFDQAIGKKTAKAREAERRAEEAERRAEEAQRKLEQFNAPVHRDVPPYPDSYESDFQDKLKQREAVIAHNARVDWEMQQRQQQDQVAQQAKAQREQAALQETVATYTQQAAKLGITQDRLAQAGASVAQFGIHNDLVTHILADDHGPAITVYLADHPLELEQVASLSPLQAAAYIEREVKPKMRKKVDPPPAPVPTLKGSGVPEKDRGVSGSRYS